MSQLLDTRFYLQYRDAPSDTPIIEFRSPMPLPVPRKGERVQLFETGNTTPKAAGTVDHVDWAYRLGKTEYDEEIIEIAARVWLQQEPTLDTLNKRTMQEL